MYKTIASLALLKVSWDKNQKDYIENFVPFIVTLMHRKKYQKVDVNTICDDFSIEFGLLIPYHPMLTILGRVTKRGYIKRENGQYFPDNEKIAIDDFSDIAGEQERQYRKVVNEFIKFSQENYDETLTEDEADAVFIGFLKEHDLDVLFANASQDSILPDSDISTSRRFLINKFVQQAHGANPEMFRYIVSISIGHIMANTILNREYKNYQGKLSGRYYLDTGLLFSIVGINGEEQEQVHTDFISLLKSFGVKLHVFRHTYMEFIGIFEACLHWVDNVNYDPRKASRTLQYFMDAGCTASDVELFIEKIDQRLDKLGITIEYTPDPNANQAHQIDELGLAELIINTYKEANQYFDEEEKKHTIDQDVKSIAAIYKLRKGEIPRTLKRASEVFITRNSTLAYAARLFEIRENSSSSHFIPAVLTDVFVGTLAWINAPARMTTISEQRMIANCYAALQPTSNMMKLIVDSAENLLVQGKIDESDAQLFKVSHSTRSLLQDKLLGDTDRFTESSLLDIRDSIREKIRHEEKVRFDHERAGFLEEKKGLTDDLSEQTRAKEIAETTIQRVEVQLNGERQENQRINNRLMNLSSSIGTILAWVVSIIAIMMFCFALLVNIFPSIVGNKSVWVITVTVITAIVEVLSFIFGFDIKNARTSIQNSLRDKLYRELSGKTKHHNSMI